MKTSFRSAKARQAIICILLIFYFCVICLINYASVPDFYDADMYCDYRYAEEVWEHKSLFPEGWVFGNQLNAVSTPVLAALIYGVSQNMNFSMATACIIMAVLTVLSYDWMVKPVLQDIESRLVAILFFVTVVLYCGQAVEGNQGWTLFFSMCSYYSGYSITAFLSFGCYLRGLLGNIRKRNGMLAISCILSFGTGIQSIRQTAIMSVPILAVEFLRMLFTHRSWKANKAPLWIALAIAGSNLCGLCYVRMLEINQHQVFGSIGLTSFQDLSWSAGDCIALIQDLLRSGSPEDLLVQWGLLLLVVASLILVIRNTVKTGNYGSLVLYLLMAISVLVIIAIDVFTTMYIRPRYYFILYPFFSFLVAYVYMQPRLALKNAFLVLIVLFFCLAWFSELPDVIETAITCEEDPSYEISEYLIENGYTTIYATWWHGQDVAVASNNRIQVGFWYTEDRPFEAITHLCSLDIYHADPSECVYFFAGKEPRDLGIGIAQSMGVDMELLCYYPEKDTYIYTAPVNLMQMIG